MAIKLTITRALQHHPTHTEVKHSGFSTIDRKHLSDRHTYIRQQCEKDQALLHSCKVGIQICTINSVDTWHAIRAWR